MSLRLTSSSTLSAGAPGCRSVSLAKSSTGNAPWRWETTVGLQTEAAKACPGNSGLQMGSDLRAGPTGCQTAFQFNQFFLWTLSEALFWTLSEAPLRLAGASLLSSRHRSLE